MKTIEVHFPDAEESASGWVIECRQEKRVSFSGHSLVLAGRVGSPRRASLTQRYRRDNTPVRFRRFDFSDRVML